MSQDVNQDWANRDFVESIEMAMRKCVDFLSDFHEQAKYRLSEVDQRLTSLERKVDFVEAQLVNADPSQRNAKPKSFKGSTFDPSVRREQVKKFRERLVKTEKVFSDRIIAPRKADGARGKLIVGGPKQSSQPQEILGAPKNLGKGNIPIAQMQKQMSKPKQADQQASSPPSASGAPKSKAAIAAAAIPIAPMGGNGGAAGPPGGGNKPAAQNRPPPSAAQAQAALAQKKGPPAGPGGGGPPGPPQPPGPPAAPAAAQPQPPGPPAVPAPPNPPGGGGGGPGAGPGGQQPPPPKPPAMDEPGAEGTSGTGEGGTPGVDGPGAGGFPHHDPNAIDLQIVKPGNGLVPGGKSKVEVEYVGYLEDGSKFIEHRETLSLGLKQNIKGLEAGLQRMQEGTLAKLWIPSKLGYGVRGAPPLIPQNADLMFEITLIKILD